MQELLFALMVWAMILSGYPAPDGMPKIRYAPSSFFVFFVCTPIMRPCKIVGYYDDNGTIYIHDKYRDMDHWAGSSIMVHEMVHYLQPEGMNMCAREKEAYHIQNVYLSQILNSTKYIMPPYCKEESYEKN